MSLLLGPVTKLASNIAILLAPICTAEQHPQSIILKSVIWKEYCRCMYRAKLMAFLPLLS